MILIRSDLKFCVRMLRLIVALKAISTRRNFIQKVSKSLATLAMVPAASPAAATDRSSSSGEEVLRLVRDDEGPSSCGLNKYLRVSRTGRSQTVTVIIIQ